MIKRASRHPAVHGLFAVFILTVPGFLQMCGRSSQDPKSVLRMVNGSTPTPDHPASWSAVALVDKSTSDHFCSGTIVAENLIVTAAHCVFDKRPEEFRIMFGKDTKSVDSVFRDAEAKETFKKFQKFESNFDIAWVRFKGGLPAGFRPIEIWHQPDLLQPRTPLTIAGYGRTASQCEFDDPSCQGGKLLYVDTQTREFVNHGRLFNLIVIGPRKDHGPCFGDSGGPAYLQKDGRWYVVGDFMGWDRILVSEQIDTICDTGEAIYNFVGDFVSWIEETSKQTLAHNESLNPRQSAPILEFLTEEPQSFQGWCHYNNHQDPAWFTVQRLIRLTSDFRIQSGDPEGAREVFENCEVAETWLRKMIQAQPSLMIAGFDPANFIDSARLEDIRPLKVLGDMGLEELTLTDHSILDLSPLAAIKSLKKLEIIDNIVRNRQDLLGKASLAIASFPQLEVLHLQNSGAMLDFEGLRQLKNIYSLDLSYLEVNTLKGLDQLPLQELRLDSVKSEGGIDLSLMENLQTLYLSKVSLLGLATKMNQLESLELLEVTGLKNLPLEAAALKKLFLYASDWTGELKLNPWPKMEEISLYSNPNMSSVSGLSNFPQLRFLEISENNLQTVGEISQMPQLRVLTLTQNNLTSLPVLLNLPKLEKLDLGTNKLSSLQDLGSIPSLEYLDASHNPLQNLDGVAKFPLLKRLVLQNEKGEGLTNLQGMRDLPQLTELNIARNSVHDLREVLPLSQLEVLIINDNFIEDLSPLKALPKLEYIEAVNNPLKNKACPITSKAEACRFEWMYISRNGPITFAGSLRAQ